MGPQGCRTGHRVGWGSERGRRAKRKRPRLPEVDGVAQLAAARASFRLVLSSAGGLAAASIQIARLGFFQRLPESVRFQPRVCSAAGTEPTGSVQMLLKSVFSKEKNTTYQDPPVGVPCLEAYR